MKGCARSRLPGWPVAVLALIALGGQIGGARAQDRKCLGIVLDNSSSMTSSDPNRQAVRAAAVLGDLLSDGDSYGVFPINGSTWALLDPHRREDFHRSLDSMRYDGVTPFVDGLGMVDEFLQKRSVKDGNGGSRNLVILLGDGDVQDLPDSLPIADRIRGRGVPMEGIFIGDVGATNFETLLGPGHASIRVTSAERAQSDAAMIEAFATVFQRFLGAKNLQRGLRVARPTFETTTSSRIRRGLLLVVGEGRLPPVKVLSGQSPAAIREGTIGGRMHRVLVFEPAPPSDRFRFEVPVASQERYSWLWLEDIDLDIQYRGDTVFNTGIPGRIAVQTVAGTPPAAVVEPKASIETVIEGRTVRLVDDGTAGDGAPGDGLFAAEVTFHQESEGKTIPLDFVLTSDVAERHLVQPVDVKRILFTAMLDHPPSVGIGMKEALKVVVKPTAKTPAGSPPPTVGVTLEDSKTAAVHVLRMQDDGVAPDETAADLVFTASLPDFRESGDWSVHATVEFLADKKELSGQLRVEGRLVVPPGFQGALDFGTLQAGDEREAALDLSKWDIRGEHEVPISIDGPRNRGLHIEVATEDGWESVSRDASDNRIRIREGTDSIRFRARVDECPGKRRPGADPLVVSMRFPDTSSFDVDLVVIVQPQSFWHCYGTYVIIATVATLLFLYFLGWFTHPTFHGRLGFNVEESPAALFTYSSTPLKRIAGRRWYRPAQAFVCTSGGGIEIRGKSRDGVARIEAGRDGAVTVFNLSGRLICEDVTSRSGWRSVAESERVELGRVYGLDGGNAFLGFRLE